MTPLQDALETMRYKQKLRTNNVFKLKNVPGDKQVQTLCRPRCNALSVSKRNARASTSTAPQLNFDRPIVKFQEQQQRTACSLSMRSYLFEPAPLQAKGASNVSIDEAEDYDFAHLDGVAKEYAASSPDSDANDSDGNPLKKVFRATGSQIKEWTVTAWRRIMGMTRKQQIIALTSTIVVAIVLGFTLGYLTPDDEDTPLPASFYHNNDVKYTVTESNSDDVEMAALVAEVSAGDGSEQYAALPDAPIAIEAQEDEEVSATGFFGGLFGIGNLFGKHQTRYTISNYQFANYEEIALLNNVAYCIPSPGITAPFNCTRACEIFSPGVEIVLSFTNTAFDTSATGYIAVDHRPMFKRILIVFRGSQSLANWMTNLDTFQDPYPYISTESTGGCENCRVHRGFLKSYLETKELIFRAVKDLKADYPDYTILVTGHSLGGAIAVLAGADLITSGYEPVIITYGQPRVGNSYFADWFDYIVYSKNLEFTRITHKSDPVVRVPLGIDYTHSTGEVYIAKGPLSPTPEDCYICEGQEDSECSTGEGVITTLAISGREVAYRAHVEYFTRIGLCRFQI